MIRIIPRLLAVPHFLAILLFAVAVGNEAQARSVFGKPIYNPETKSYFELIDGSFMNGGQGPNWSEANELAQEKQLGKTQGRLGIIPSAQVEMFVRLNLRPFTNMWIGLYYDCSSKSLVWVDGRPLRPGDYTNWAPGNWYNGHTGMFCNTSIGTRMPVFIGLAEAERNWLIQLPAKRWHLVLVEYPTGGPLGGEQNQSMKIPEDGKSTVKPASETAPDAAKKAAQTAKTEAAATTAPAVTTPKPMIELKADRLPPGAGLPPYDPARDTPAGR